MDKNLLLDDKQLMQKQESHDLEALQEKRVSTISYLISIIFHLLLVLLISLFGGKGISPKANARLNLYPVKFYELKGSYEEMQNTQIDKTTNTLKEERAEVSIEKLTHKKEIKPIREIKKTEKSKMETTTKSPTVPKEEIGKGVKFQKAQPSKVKEYEGEGESIYPGDTLFPTVKNAVKPVYPKSAQNREEEGVVHLKAFILSDGTTKEVIIEKSSGSDILDEAAKNKIMKSWEFAPKITKGRPTDAWIFITCIFTLENLNVECKY